MKRSEVRNHLSFWSNEVTRKSLNAAANRLSPRMNEIVVRALEITGQPHELDLLNPDPMRNNYLVDSFALAPSAMLQIPQQSPGLGVDGHWWPPVRVHHLRNVKLDASSGLVFAGNRVLSQSGTGHRWTRDASFISGAFRRAQSDEYMQIEGPIATLGQSNNYYHFLIEALPRIIRVHSLVPDITFLTETVLPEFAHQILDSLGLADRVVITGAVVQSDDLWICEPQPLFWPHPENLCMTAQALKDLCREAPSDCFSTSIYISRSRSSRSLAHEAELELHLKGLGFDILHLEDLPVCEQVARFAAAEVIVAPHGAGLSNLIFLRPSARVIELSSGEWWWPCFRRMAHSMLLKYDFLQLLSNDTYPFGNGLDAIPLIERALSE